MDRNKYLLLELANLEVDSKIGKDRHFIAADRKNIRRIALGLFSVIGTAIIASKAIKDVFQAITPISGYEALFISTISLLVGVSTAILGFLGLEKQVSQHRLVGNMYIEVSRKARRLINRLHEGEAVDTVKSEFQTILTEYLSINKEGESCPTSKKDSIKSLTQNSSSRGKIKGEIKKQDDQAMQLTSPPKALSLKKLVINGLKIRMAEFFCYINIISTDNRDLYLKKFEEK
ncbi:SLATT domain-containing protein [Pseudomonas umsongensis]|uniref:SLATT domain-containing protein n=1 Tax=Pseudomonas umsongensis TaxID=198618 RepID=UPI00037755C2|nr:SLATT domain-containing protein [Pseudomonas umsongensis]